MRWKESEQEALAKLNPTDASHITPIIELVPAGFKLATERSVEKIAKGIASHWRGFAFLDVGLLKPETAKHAIPAIRKEFDFYRSNIGIVTRFDAPYQSEIKSSFSSSPLCIRLRVSDLEIEYNQLRKAIGDFLRFHGKRAKDVHLIVDFEMVANDTIPIAAYLNNIPFFDEWVSVIALLGAFPEDLAAIEKNSQQLLPRFDWIVWSEFAASNRNRPVNFGDYNIMCGRFKDNEGKRRNFSASLRYTSKDSWVIMRGEGVYNDDGPGFQQYPAQALLLCERAEFEGASFSEGDRYIYEMAQQSTSTGNVKSWLSATINHHLTFVPRQISSTFSSLGI